MTTKLQHRELGLLKDLSSRNITVHLPTDAILVTVEQTKQPIYCDIYLIPHFYLLYLSDSAILETKEFTLVIPEADGTVSHPADRLRYLGTITHEGQDFLFFELDSKHTSFVSDVIYPEATPLETALTTKFFPEKS